MAEYTVKAQHDAGTGTPATIIKHVEGVSDSYGPGGFGVGFVKRGDTGNYEHGVKREGPWGYLFGRPAVIDNFGGTSAEWAEANGLDLLIDTVRAGDVFIDAATGERHVLEIRPLGTLRLLPEPARRQTVTVTFTDYTDMALGGSYEDWLRRHLEGVRDIVVDTVAVGEPEAPESLAGMLPVLIRDANGNTLATAHVDARPVTYGMGAGEVAVFDSGDGWAVTLHTDPDGEDA